MSAPACYPNKAPAVNRLCETLSHHIRREVIHYFENYTEEETATLDEVVDHIIGRIPGSDTERLEIELVHMHLPKLAERGWIDHDSRTNEIRYYGHEDARNLLNEVRDIF